MCRDHRERISVAVAFLNPCTTDRIRIVTCPNLWEIAKHSRVKPIAASRASFKKDIRETFRQRFGHPVKSADITVRRFALPMQCLHLPGLSRLSCSLVIITYIGAACQIWRVNIRKDPVHIPFDICDICRRKDFCHPLDHIINHFRICQIQYSLVTSLRVGAPRDLHRPVRMCTIQITVCIYHFRLDPDPELQSQVIDLFTNTGKSAGQFLFINIPVTQRRLIVITVSEPSVIHDKQLDAHLACFLRQFQQFFFINIKISRFPAVQQYGTHFLFPCSAYDVLSDERMHLMTHTGKSLTGDRHGTLRTLKGIPRLKVPGKTVRIDAGAKTRLTIRIDFCCLIVISTVEQMEPIADPLLFCRVFLKQHHKRIGAV